MQDIVTVVIKPLLPQEYVSMRPTKMILTRGFRTMIIKDSSRGVPSRARLLNCFPHPVLLEEAKWMLVHSCVLQFPVYDLGKRGKTGRIQQVPRLVKVRLEEEVDES